MINWKWCIIFGGIGLGLSLFIGLFSGAGISSILIRAFIFAVVFFGIGAGLWFLISTFIPELLFPGAISNNEQMGDSSDRPGSRINITLDDNKSLPQIFLSLNNGDDVGDIGDLVSGKIRPQETLVQDITEIENRGVDQKPEDGYNERGSQNNQIPADFSGGMPGLDFMSGSFLGNNGEKADVPGQWSEPERKKLSNKTQSLKGDFNPKELAEGIRTILSEDE